MKPIYLITAISISCLALIGCTKTEQAPVKEVNSAKTLQTLTIGYQKSALKLIVAKQNRMFEQAFPNVKVEWKEFATGPQTLDALSAKSIDFGYTLDGSVVSALSQGKELKYLGYEQAFHKNHAILVLKTNSLQHINDLQGKKIGLTKGSSAHIFLAETLRNARLTWEDIQPVWLEPIEARQALTKGKIDAWVVWEPYTSATELTGIAKVIFDSGQSNKSYGFYLAKPELINANPESAKKILTVLNRTDEWIDSHPQESSEILAKNVMINPNVAAQIISKKPTPDLVSVVTPEIVQSQQNISNFLVEWNILPNKIDPQKYVWDGK